MNLCSACGLDFSNVGAFERHRVGRHSYTFAEGIAKTPPVEDGRRCLTLSELEGRGWAIDGRGRWMDATSLRGTLRRRDRRGSATPQDASRESGAPVWKGFRS